MRATRGAGARWRAVAVLLAPDAAAARRASAIVGAELTAFDARVYRSGGHLVIVTAVAAASGRQATARLSGSLAGLVPPAWIADVWSGSGPLAA